MKLLKMNKNILKEIFSFINNKRMLKIIKYSKKLMSRMDITKLSYQKIFFDLVITPGLLANPSILLKNKILDKESTQKLILEWEKEITGIFEEKNIFYFHSTDIPNNLKILEVNKNNEKDLNKSFPKLIILNLYDLDNIEIPCSLLTSIESLYFKDVKNIKFLSSKSNISLNKLKHLCIDNISFGRFSENDNLNIKINNLEYLDLQVKEIDGEDEDEEEEEEEEENSEDISRKGFIKNELFKYLIKIFNFKFLSEFITDKDEEEEDIDFEMYDTYISTFKNPKILFREKSLEKLNYFNFKIYYSLNIASGAYELNRNFDFTYLFSKTNGNKYKFQTIYEYMGNGDDCNFHIIEKENRYCNEFRYNDYYFKNNEISIEGNDFRMFEKEINLKEVNKLKFDLNYDGEISLDIFIDLFDNFECNNKILESLHLNVLDKNDEMKIIKNINKFVELKVFIIYDDCLLKNDDLMKLMKNLSVLNSLFLIEISFQRKLNLNEKEKEIIHKLFPDISIKTSQKSSSIKWNSNNIELKLRNNYLNNKEIGPSN